MAQQTILTAATLKIIIKKASETFQPLIRREKTDLMPGHYLKRKKKKVFYLEIIKISRV